MDPRELAGREGGKGKSAEFLFRARERDGFPGKTCETVRGICRGCAIRLQGVLLAHTVGRGVSLPFFFEKNGGHSHEI